MKTKSFFVTLSPILLSYLQKSLLNEIGHEKGIVVTDFRKICAIRKHIRNSQLFKSFRQRQTSLQFELGKRYL